MFCSLNGNSGCFVFVYFFFFLTFPALSMFGTTIGLYGIPWCNKSLLLTVLMSVIGASMGILDTGKGSCGLTVPSPHSLETSSLTKPLLIFHVTCLELKEGAVLLGWDSWIILIPRLNSVCVFVTDVVGGYLLLPGDQYTFQWTVTGVRKSVRCSLSSVCFKLFTYRKLDVSRIISVSWRYVSPAQAGPRCLRFSQLLCRKVGP